MVALINSWFVITTMALYPCAVPSNYTSQNKERKQGKQTLEEVVIITQHCQTMPDGWIILIKFVTNY